MSKNARSRFSMLAAAGIALGWFILMPNAVMAQRISLVPDCARFQTETPGLDCVLDAFLGFARFILSITGSVALLIFVLAGFMYLVNAGNPDQAKKATSYITNAAIGLVIIFSSGILVNYLQRQLLGKDVTDNACTSLGSDFSCVTLDSSNKELRGINCKTGLCLSQASTNYQCCQPVREPYISERCKAAKGADFKCIDLDQDKGSSCATGFCPGGTNIKCCKPEAGAGGGTGGAARTGCSNFDTGEFLGCTNTSCQASGQPCAEANASNGCLSINNDVRCGSSPTASESVYGCRDLQDQTLKGCVEVPLVQFCEDACGGAQNCTLSNQPDSACFGS